MSGGKVEYERRGDVALVTLNDPDTLNAITLDMLEQLGEAIERAGEARAMILTGAGRGFCSGAALKGALARGDGRATRRWPAGPRTRPKESPPSSNAARRNSKGAEA